MAETKMMDCKCSHKGKKYMLLGVAAIVYGIILYMIDVMVWAPYLAWIVGGVILLLISWAQKSTSNS